MFQQITAVYYRKTHSHSILGFAANASETVVAEVHIVAAVHSAVEAVEAVDHA